MLYVHKICQSGQSICSTCIKSTNQNTELAPLGSKKRRSAKSNDRVAWDTDPRSEGGNSETDDVFSRPPQTMLLDSDAEDQVQLSNFLLKVCMFYRTKQSLDSYPSWRRWDIARCSWTNFRRHLDHWNNENDQTDRKDSGLNYLKTWHQKPPLPLQKFQKMPIYLGR